jgi:DAACS family dicarboxylate/amino acid:cation (Na+ or H+) symporter
MSARGTHHRSILLGLAVGAVAGVVANALAAGDESRRAALAWFSDWVAYPVGQIFLRLLFLVVVPLVFAALAASVARLGDLAALGRMGVRTVACFLMTTAFSVALGLVAMRLAAPGDGFDPAMRAELMQAFAGEAQALESKAPPVAGSGATATVNLVLEMFLPRNVLGAVAQMQMLPLIAFALLLGAGLGVQPAARRAPVVAALDAVSDAMTWIVGAAMRLAPVAVACLIFVATSRFGLALLGRLSVFVALVLGLYAVQLLVLYPALVAALARRRPFAFLRGCLPIMATAFSTSSSNATLPTSIEVCTRDLGIRPAVASFVLPLGATVNMNGTALFEGCVVLFVAQVFGVELSLAQQGLVLVLCVLSAIGVAGVPGGSLPLLMVVMAQVGVPAEGIALVLGVDRLLDMGRTVVNVMGDVVTAAFVESRLPAELT